MTTYRRLHRNAVRCTVLLAVPFAVCAAQVVYSYAHDEASGAFVFFITGVYAVAAALILRHLWRRVRDARPDEPPAGSVVTDRMAASHPSISGDAELPSRW